MSHHHHNHEHHRPQRWAEGWHQTIGVTITVALIATTIWAIGRYVPMGPAPSAAELSKLGLDKASRLSYQERAR